MRLSRRRLLVALAVVLVGMQFVRPDHGAPPENADEAIFAKVKTSPEVFRVLEKGCFDCHSHRTEWPWYSQVAPVSWFVAHHVDEGREHLNLSTWGRLTDFRAQKLLEEIGEEVAEGHMPLRSYRWMHRDADLREGEVQLLRDWSERSSQEVLERLEGEEDPSR